MFLMHGHQQRNTAFCGRKRATRPDRALHRPYRMQVLFPICVIFKRPHQVNQLVMVRLEELSEKDEPSVSRSQLPVCRCKIIPAV